MIDLRWLREQPDAFDRALARRGQPPAAAAMLELDAARRAIETAAAGGPGDPQPPVARDRAEVRPAARSPSPALLAEMAALKERVKQGEDELRELQARLDALLPTFPNVLADDVPDGPDEAQQRRAAALGRSAQLRLRPAPARGGRRRARHGLRPRRAAVRRPFRRAVGPARRARAGARPVHARPADPRARLHARSRCPIWSATRRCSAPASCPSWRRISSAPLPATS